MQRCHFVEVGTKLPSVTNRNLHLARLGQFHFVEPTKVSTELLFKLFVPPLLWIELHEKRAIGGMQISNAHNRLRFQQKEQLADLLIRLNCDFFAEINQQRLVTRWLKSQAVPCNFESCSSAFFRRHFRESISPPRYELWSNFVYGVVGTPPLEGFTSFPTTNANSPRTTPEMSPTTGPTTPIISFGEPRIGIEFIIAASRAWPAR